MKYFISFFLIGIGFTVCAQIIPDLTQGEHYRPYASESQKQELIVNNYLETLRKKYPQTSEELYPQLYRYVQRQFLGAVSGTSSAPENAFPNYARAPVVKTTTPAPYNSYSNFTSTVDQRNRAIVEADMAAYQSRRAESERVLYEADEALYKPVVNYHLGFHSGEKVTPFIDAQQEISQMLAGEKRIDFLRAVWLIENAVDRTLSWDEFNSMFQDGVQAIGSLMAKEKLNRNDNLAKIMAIYKFMADTTRVYIASKEKNVTSKPMLYDYDDYEAKKDITKVFVSKLLRTGTGQCMSLPMLYYLFGKTIKADVNLSFAPQHSFITFKDHNGNRQNIELTGRMFTSTDFYWATGFIKAEQVKAGIYLKPLSEKETLAHLMTTLALSYIRTFGTDERALEMALTARNHSPTDLTANMIVAGYSQDLYNHVLRQYDVFRLNEDQLAKDQEAQRVHHEMREAIDHLKKDLGYAEMPDWAYKKWLEGVNELANKKQHIVRRRQLEQQLNR